MAEVLGSYVAHGTHTKFAAVLKDITVSETPTKDTITITATGRHYNNDTHANTVSVNSLNGIVSFTGSGTVSPADIDYPSAVVSVAAGKGKTADGNTLTYTLTVSRTTSDIIISNIKFLLTSSLSDKTSTATWGSSITVPAATISFSPQTLSKTFSTSSQTVSFTGASGGSGSYSYTKKTETNSSNVTTNYFSLSGHTFTIAASTPANTYKMGVTAKDNATGATANVIITVVIKKASGGTVTFNDQNFTKTFSTSAQTMTLSAASGGVGTITYAIQSQKNASGTAVSNFTLSGTTLTMAANTGPNTYTIVVRATAPGNSNYNSSIKDATIKVIVNQAPLSNLKVTMAGWTYGNTASNPSVSGNSGNGAVTYNYKVSTAADSTYTATKPSNAGTYTVRASVAATTNYSAGTATANFTIAKANISPTVTMANWAYGGTASNPSVSGNSGNGTVTYNYKLKSAADSAYSTTKPSDAGTYTIRASIAATTNYNAGTATKDFSITFTATPTAYSAQYNGSAHSASIKTSVGGAKVEYGTSTSYGYSLTTTTANTNYTMSSVSATNVADSKTVYYKATKNGYTVTGSTSITITKANPTLSVTGKTNLTYTGSVQALVSAWSVAGGGTVYLGLGSSSTTAPTSWSTNASPTATNAGTYYIWAKADTSANYNAVSQVYKISVTIAKANISPSVTMANWAYGGTASNPSVSGNSGNGQVTYNYKLKSAADSAYSTTKPSDAGVYTVKATIATTTNYNSGTATKDFSITFTATPTPYNAVYNGSAHSASIKTSVGGATINYGTSTSYGYSLTATNANTNYTMSSVSATNVADSKTVYYKATKNGYTVTSSTSITITKATPTLSVTGATLTFNNSAQTLVSAASVSGNGTIYYGLGSSTTSAPASTAWSTTKPTATNIGTYYIWAKADTSPNYNAVAAAYKASATIKAGTYTITLNANGGSGGSTSVNITYGTKKGSYPTITKPTRTGYSFTGFYSATSGGTQWYDANGNSVRDFDLLANTTWYAQWTINSYNLTIDPNGGSWNNSTSVSTVSQNYATTKSIAAPTRTGYTFVGWAETGPGHLSKINQTDPAFDSSSGGVAIYNNSGGGTVTHTRQSSSAGTAYGSYEILISSSSGTTSPGNGGFYQPTTSAENKKYIHAFVAKIPTGYTVQQACNATGNGRTITWLTDRYGTGAYRVYAYQHNCGSGGTFSTFGHVYLDTGSRPVSWQLAYSAMKDITDGTADTYTYGAGAGRITALWAGNKYSVAFNANGGSGSMTTETDFFYGTAKALSANGFTAPSGGYSFIGWATSAANAAAGTVAYSNQGNMTTGTTTNGGTVTLYAVWRRSITFKHGKANATTNTVYQYYGGNVTPPTITAISTWTPLGWRDDTSAGAKEYGANNTTAFAYTSTVQTLYAVYSRTLTVSYGANGGTGTTPSNTTTTQYYNANGAITSPAVTLATNPYSQTGCTFSHWLVSTSNTNVASGGSYTWSIAVDASTVSRVASAQWNINVTATNGNATYNGSAHSASISIGIAGATVEYGTSTSYGYTLTATNANTNYSMSSVSATTVAQSTTVYYRVSKSGYLAKTGSTTVTISKRTVTPTAPTLTTGTLTYDGTAKTLASAGSCTTGGQMYYYVGTSATAPAFSTSTWSTSISTETNAGTYYVFWYCYVSDTANNNDTSSDNINITKSLGSRTIGKATLTITPTAYSADYNGVAHSAQIKCTNVDGVTIDYGTSTSYGNTLTATSKNTNYAMSSVTRTNPGTTTVHYKASKTNYNDVTSSTTITITGVPVHSNINGTWKHGIVYVNVNGTWKKATAGYRNVNGTWKPIDK